MDEDERSEPRLWSAPNAGVATATLATAGVLLAIAFVAWPKPDREQARQVREALRPVAMALAAHEACWIVAASPGEDSTRWTVIHRHAAGGLKRTGFEQSLLFRRGEIEQLGADGLCPSLVRVRDYSGIGSILDCAA